LEKRFEKIAEAEYDGIEALMPSPEEEATIRRLLKDYGFVCVIQIGRDGGTIGPSKRTRSEPLLINSHSAIQDATYEEHKRLLLGASSGCMGELAVARLPHPTIHSKPAWRSEASS
jgi:hypothetical protein